MLAFQIFAPLAKPREGLTGELFQSSPRGSTPRVIKSSLTIIGRRLTGVIGKGSTGGCGWNHFGSAALNLAVATAPWIFQATIDRLVFAKGVVDLKHSAQQAQSRAEALFARKEAQRREGEKAMAEYEAGQLAIQARTARLRALRLAHESAAPAATAPARRGRTAASRG